MTLANYTHIVLLIDRSGSMSIIREDAQGGINTFIEENKKLDSKCTFTLYQFDTEFERVYGPGDLQLVGEYRLQPRGGTALMDAQWRAINETGDYLRAMPESLRPSKVIFLTVTDGEENSSHEIVGISGRELLNAKVEEQKNKYGWDFAYIGAGQDAFAVGSSYGYTNTMGYQPTPKSTRAMYGNLAFAASASRGSGLTMDHYLASSVDSEGNLTYGNSSNVSSSTKTTTVQTNTAEADSTEEE